MQQFLGILQADYGYRPSQRPESLGDRAQLSPRPYLEERIESIIDQTLRPHEIIFLDDASPDDSVEIARRLARRSTVPIQIVVNEQNNGSTFRQWLKGLSLATGDLVWIAESDDSAHPYLLERLVRGVLRSRRRAGLLPVGLDRLARRATRRQLPGAHR